MMFKYNFQADDTPREMITSIPSGVTADMHIYWANADQNGTIKNVSSLPDADDGNVCIHLPKWCESKCASMSECEEMSGRVYSDI